MTTVRLRHLAQVNPLTPAFDRLSDEDELTFLPMEAVWPGSRLDITRRRAKASVATGYTRFQDGDVLVPKITPTFEAGRAVLIGGLLGGVGTGTTELHVVRPGPQIDPRFLLYVVNTHSFLKLGEAEMYGVAGQQRVPDAFLRNLPVELPPLEEQRRITAFLDTETARMDNLAGLGERQINLLRERSEAMVIQFFGPGDGRREYRFRHLMESNPCYGVLVPKFADVGVPLIRVSDLGRLDHDLERLPKIEEEQAQEYRRTCVRPGDLLITVVGATIGRCDVAPPEIAGFNVSRALARVQLAAGISPQMIASWVRGRDFRIQAELATSGAAAQPALNMSDITHFTLWLPETHSGRLDLARRVSTHEDETRRLLSAIERKQTLIAERRQALITAAVTGEFDVSTASGRNVTDGVTA
ncbi:restriction endonuclease subunit S [Streptomyces massasporeus]